MLRQLRIVSLVGAAMLALLAVASQAADPTEGITPKVYALQDISGVDGLYSHASAINNLGHVIGEAATEEGAYYGYVWRNGEMIRLTLGGQSSYTVGINEKSQVIGNEYMNDGTLRAFLWDPDPAKGFQDLGTPSGTSSMARAINEEGQVVGGWNGHAFLWDSSNGMQLLENLGGISSSPIGINNQGQVMGVVDSGMALSGFLWEPGGVVKGLGSLSGPLVSLDGINELGQIVGTYYTNDPDNPGTLAFVSQDEVATPLTLGGTESYSTGMNDRGQVIGNSSLAFNSTEHAFLWDSANGIRALGALPGGDSSFARAINERGQVIGWATTAHEQRAVLWDPVTGIQDLGTLSGCAYTEAVAINNQGHVLCMAQDTISLKRRPFVWHDGEVFELGTLGGTASVGLAINDRGQVAGTSWLPGDQVEHGFIASLVNTPPGPDVEIEPIPTVGLTFDSVVSPGETTVTTTSAPATQPPSNFQVSGAVYYDIHTTATYSGTIQLRFDYDPIQFPDEQNVKLLHLENGVWVDVTTSVDRVNNVVFGETTSFSPFAIVKGGYSWSGVLQPVNADGTSIFKQGSTIPVKFQLTGESAGLTDVTARLFVAKLSEGVAGTELEAVSTSAADAGNVFRKTNGQYQFNLGTRGMSEGTWRMRIDMNDGALHTVDFSIRK